MAKHRRWTSDELQQIARLRDEGLNLGEIAEMFGTSRWVVRRALKSCIEVDGQIRPDRRRAYETDRVQALNLRAKGLSWEEIADMLNVHAAQLESLCNRYQAQNDGTPSDVLMCGDCRKWAYTGKMIWPYGKIGICERDGATVPRSNKCRYGDDD